MAKAIDYRPHACPGEMSRIASFAISLARNEKKRKKSITCPDRVYRLPRFLGAVPDGMLILFTLCFVSG
jgi:hypothetical protein